MVVEPPLALERGFMERPGHRLAPLAAVGQMRSGVDHLEAGQRHNGARPDAPAAIDGVARQKEAEDLSAAVRQNAQFAGPPGYNDELPLRAAGVLSHLRASRPALDAAPKGPDVLRITALASAHGAEY